MDLVSETLFNSKEDLVTYIYGIFPYLCRMRDMSDTTFITFLANQYPSLGFQYFSKLFNDYYEIR